MIFLKKILMALIPQISKPKKEIARFLQQVPAGSQNIETFFSFFLNFHIWPIAKYG